MATENGQKRISLHVSHDYFVLEMHSIATFYKNVSVARDFSLANGCLENFTLD